MTLKRKTVRVLAGLALVGLAGGCGGVNASKTVTPLDFLLPGAGSLLHVKAAPAGPPTNHIQFATEIHDQTQLAR